MGSPASASSSTTEPWASCRMYLIGTFTRPSSTDSVTGMSCMVPSLLKAWRGASAPDSGPPCSGSGVAVFCSSSASAQAAIGSSSALSLGSSVAMAVLRMYVVAAQAFLDADRVLGVVGAVLAIEDGHAADGGGDAGLAFQFDEIARLHGQQLLHRGIGPR